MITKKNNGFTLVEMMVVIALILILLTFVLVNLNKNRIIARDNVRIADIDTIRLALEEYKVHCGVYPATLDADTNNTKRVLARTSSNGCSKKFGDFLVDVPKNQAYSANNDQFYQGSSYDRESYIYHGVSHIQGGPCFDYIIGVQLEYGSNNDFNSEHKNDFAKVNQVGISSNNGHQYNQRCGGSNGRGIEGADDGTYGIYGFRSTDRG